MTNPLASPWIPTMVLPCLITFNRMNRRSWLAPSTFAPLVWFFYLLIPLSIAPEYHMSGITGWVIVLMIASMVAGAWLTEDPTSTKHVSLTEDTCQISKYALRLLVCFSSAALAGEIYLAYLSLEGSDLPYTASAILALGHLLSVERYAGAVEPTGVRILVTWMYPSALLGGMVFVLAKKKVEKLLSLSAIVPALMSGLFQSTKAPSLITVCCWLSAYLSMKVYITRGEYRLFNRRILTVIIVLIIGAVSLFIGLDAIRTHNYGEDLDVSPDWSRIKGSTIGYLAVFDKWVTAEHQENLGYGAFTFAGIFDLVGVHSRALGLYEEIIMLPGNIDSNIYTAFRGLIEDFSLPGAVLVCMSAGGFAGFCYRRTCMGSSKGTIGISAYYAFLIWSPIASLVVYNGPLLAWIILILVFCKIWPFANLRAPFQATGKQLVQT